MCTEEHQELSEESDHGGDNKIKRKELLDSPFIILMTKELIH